MTVSNTGRRLGAAAIALMVGILSPIHPVASTPSGSVPTGNLACEASPQDHLNRLLNAPNLRRSHWGIVLPPLTPNQNVDQSSPEPSLPEPWISHIALQFINPASYALLLTTAAALTRLGSNKSVFTSLYFE
ncbi:MAG: hypothetical protein ACFCBU_07150, partial [Cyanophyceae cyanobacterium]